ncbi:hypothetical protein NQ315_003542 [Exocentrus adspersus]|uniref:DUF4371 domain-containing protein n=1 Tax=Exocentrus adspersus TaxID=1586481 RepID=A0AAV8VDC7_9CUCU|nr:hypothetical protein NQ315_003542 [Exocentrus adspersus]
MDSGSNSQISVTVTTEGGNVIEGDENRAIIKRLIDMVIYFATQKQAFRGHDESEKSINQEIENALCFSWQVDETTDCKCMSQLSVVFRYINEGKVVERFMGFFDVSGGKKAEDLFNLLIQNFKKFDIENKLVGQTYDGASIMSGDLNGLQARIKTVAPQALFTHCYAHRLNLILQDAAMKIKEYRIFLANISGLSVFFSTSPKRMNILDKVSGNRLPSGSNTRWNFKSRTIQVIIDHRTQLVEAFDTILNSDEFSTDKEIIRESVGFKKMLNDFIFLFLLYTHLTTYFNKQIYCKDRIQNLLKTLKTFRDDKHFDEIFNNICETMGGPPAKRRKTHQEGFDDSSVFFKRVYFEILDLVSSQIDARFKDLDQLTFLDLLCKTKFPMNSTLRLVFTHAIFGTDHTFSKVFPHKCLDSLIQNYPKLFDKVKLQSELPVWYTDPNILGEPSVYSDILQFIHNNDLKNEVPQIYTLLSLILTLTCCNFSLSGTQFFSFKRIKTYSRNSMGQTRLSNLGTISIESDLVKHLQNFSGFKFHDKVIDHFAAMKNRRIDLIYKHTG